MVPKMWRGTDLSCSTRETRKKNAWGSAARRQAARVVSSPHIRVCQGLRVVILGAEVPASFLDAGYTASPRGLTLDALPARHLTGTGAR